MKLSLGLTPRDYTVSGGAVAYDTDAQAYFTANTTITSDADKNAINTFYLGLKSDGIYTKMKAMYLPLWSSATANKWNLKNPLNTDAAYRLSFATGWTHSSTGITPNGTTAYADTYLTPSTALTLNSTHLSYYSRTNITTDVYTIGAFDNTNSLSMYANYAGNNYSNQYNGANGRLLVATARGDGFFLSNRTASNIHNSWRNSTKLGTSTVSTSLGSLPTFKILLAAIQSTFVDGLKQCSFASIGDGLTDTEATNLSSRVNTLMTYFGINV